MGSGVPGLQSRGLWEERLPNFFIYLYAMHVWDGWMAGRLAGWLAGWVDGWVDGWVGGWVDGCETVFMYTAELYLLLQLSEQGGLGSTAANCSCSA